MTDEEAIVDVDNVISLEQFRLRTRRTTALSMMMN